MTQFAWHVHHDILLEPLAEKPKDEVALSNPSKTVSRTSSRLRLLKPVKGKLPAAVVKVGAAYAKAGAVYAKAGAVYAEDWAACIKARTAYARVLADHRAEIEVLHKRECPRCPWDGETIFPRRKKR